VARLIAISVRIYLILGNIQWRFTIAIACRVIGIKVLKEQTDLSPSL